MTLHHTDTDDALRSLGWHTPDIRDLRIDTTGPRDFQIGRAWSSDDAWDSIPTPGRISAFLVVEGACRIEHGTREYSVPQNHIVLLDSAIQTRLSVTTPTVRYLWHFQPTILRTPLLQRSIGTPHPVQRPTWLPLTSLSNALLAAEPSLAHSLHAARSIEHLLAAILPPAPRPWTPPQRHEGLGTNAFITALALIEQHKHLPTFTVQDVADHLNISNRRLQRAFARYSTTPRRELERQRVQDLRDALSTTPLETLANSRAFSLLATTAGFTSSTQARAALQRAEHNPAS